MQSPEPYGGPDEMEGAPPPILKRVRDLEEENRRLKHDDFEASEESYRRIKKLTKRVIALENTIHKDDLLSFVFDWFNERDPDAVMKAIGEYDQRQKERHHG